MTKKVRLSSKGQIVIPKSYREALGLTEGSEVVMVVRESTIVLVNARDVAELSRGGGKGIWGGNRKQIDRLIDGERQSWE